MIPYRSQTTPNLPSHQKSDFNYRLVKRELLCDLENRNLKRYGNGPLKFRPNMLYSLSAKLEKPKFLAQIQHIPSQVRDSASRTLASEIDTRKRELQEHQFKMVVRVEKTLRRNIAERGLSYDRYDLGGESSRGVYEKIFRIEPSRCMSKAQFIVAMQKVFGLEISLGTTATAMPTARALEADVSKLYESFAVESTALGAGMDWRSFLFVLGLVMKPHKSCLDQYLWAFALFSSEGFLDLKGDSGTRITLSSMKEMVCVPLSLGARAEVKRLLDRAWVEIISENEETRNLSEQAEISGKPQEDIRIHCGIFRRILCDTSFRTLFEAGEPFGIRDPRPWTCVLESSSYHPVLLDLLKARRRERRNEEVAQTMRERKSFSKWDAFETWQLLYSRRQRARVLSVIMGVRWKLENLWDSWNIWRRFAMCATASSLLQRVARGFIGRSRVRFMRRLRGHATQIQASTRQILNQLQYKKEQLRRRTAAITIQKTVRGLLSRRRVQGMVIALVDNNLWRVQKEREAWHHFRCTRAAHAILRVIRKYLRRKRALVAKNLADIRREVAEDMEDTKRNAALRKEIYRKKLEQWYVDRKTEYDKQVFVENQTAEQKRLVMKYRQKEEVRVFVDKAALREQQRQKEEEARVQEWLQRWEKIKAHRSEVKRAECWQSINMPETPHEKALRKDLKKRAKKHVKDVLRRADKQRIPMELPEAQDLALKEVVEMEVEAEQHRVDKEMHAAAEIWKAEQAVREKEEAAKEERHQQSLRELAARTVQGAFKTFLAKRILRQKAYQRYKKHFDPGSGHYYYEERRTHVTSWSKPLALGAYDIDCDATWVTMRDSEGDPYYYHPLTWKMQWSQPPKTVLCENCKEEFALALLEDDGRLYCASCATARVNDLLAQSPDIPILFRKVEGGLQGSSETNFTKLKVEVWPVHRLQHQDADDDS